jgi:hypothetical protein
MAAKRFILVVRGGLGNQLFQYASARALSARLGAALVLDMRTGFVGDPYGRKYELGDLKLAAALLDPDEAAWARRRFWAQRHLRWRIEHVYFKCFNSFYLPRWYRRCADFLGNDVYTLEYLQSYRYFQEIEASLRQELTLRHDLPSSTLRVADSIQGRSSISVHFRSPHAWSADGRVVAPSMLGAGLDKNYYRKAVRELSTKAPGAYFFLFSDDPHASERWAEAVGSDAAAIRVDTGNACLDLYLMSLCRHNIIANSTFSWWGAWLNRATDRIVYAPARWYTGPAMTDFYPQDWIVI